VTSEPPGEWNYDKCEECRADRSEEEDPEENVIDNDRQTAPVVQQLCVGVLAVVA